MEKIKFVTDSASDIPDKALAKYGIEMQHIPIAIDGVEYYERKSFTIEQFYRMLAQATEIPATSRITVETYLACYTRALEEGYTDLINVTLNAGGSGTYECALMARDALYQKTPDAKARMRIHVVDSRAYAICFGHAVMEGAKMARAGKPAARILRYLEEYFAAAEIYIGIYALDFAKKSGRISAASAVVGDILGVRPIISIIDGQTKTVEKIRGDRQMPQKLLNLYRKNCTDKNAPVIIVRGELEQPALELKELMDKETGRDTPIYYAGASIVINAGPKMLALTFKGEPRQ